MEPVTGNSNLMVEAPGERRSRGLVTMVGMLSFLPAFTYIRVGALQPVDFALLMLLGFCVAKGLNSGLSFSISSKLKGLFWLYALFLLVLAAFSILSIRLDFYPLFGASFLKQPIIFSLSKLLQLTALVCGFFWLANKFITRRPVLIRAMSVYWAVGVACAIYALICCAAVVALHLEPNPESLFGAYLSGGVRARGFFNEGGPFGMYLVSVVVIGFLRRHMTGRPMGKMNSAILAIAFILSDSKAAILAVAFLLLYYVMSVASFVHKVAYLVLSITLLSALGVLLNLGSHLNSYLYAYENIDQEVMTRGVDLNLVAGRISAFFIVPRMIETHPISGIGFGNYPLMRNDPRYLGGLPPIRDVEDLPAIGIPGIAAEIGIPATAWLLALFAVPFWRGRKKYPIMGIAGIYQLLAHSLGVQLTFFYPWFISACAIGSISWEP